MSFFFSVRVPFEDDHAVVSSNPAWEKQKQKLDKNIKILFSGSVSKINRSNGKVCYFKIRNI